MRTLLLAIEALSPSSSRADRFTKRHGLFVAVTLAIALVLTIYSFVIYLYRYRGLFSQQGR